MEKLEKAYRIKKAREIDALVKQRKSVGNNFFVVYQSENSAAHFRFAISVSKKYGKAVDRNLIKRRLREITRQAGIKGNKDFLIIVKPCARNLDFAEIKTNMSQLFAKAKLI